MIQLQVTGQMAKPSMHMVLGDNAMECAMQGLLPEIKYTYKGLFGGTSQEILETNSVAKAAKEAEEKAKAEANK